MPVEIRHLDDRSDDPWISYHYRGEKTALGDWRGITGAKYYVEDAVIEVISDCDVRVRFLKDGFIMNSQIKRRRDFRRSIDVQRMMEITMNCGDELSFNIPNQVLNIRVYEVPS